MKNVLVVFENKHHIESNIQKFINTLDNVVSVQMCNNIIITNDIIAGNDTAYKLIGCGFPYCYNLGDKLYGWKFDSVMIHSDVVLTIYVEMYLRTRMKEEKEFIEFG